MHKEHILFVCYGNIHRSVTAAELYENDPRYDVRSAGIGSHAKHKLTYDDINWADRSFLMGPDVLTRYGKIAEGIDKIDFSSFMQLNIPDIYNTHLSDSKKELENILKQELSPYLGEPIYELNRI